MIVRAPSAGWQALLQTVVLTTQMMRGCKGLMPPCPPAASWHCSVPCGDWSMGELEDSALPDFEPGTILK